MSLEDRLTAMAEAATRASSGIDTASALASFRRRRRTRLAASTLAAAAAVVGLALGAESLRPAPFGLVDPASRDTGELACGRVLHEALRELTGLEAPENVPEGTIIDSLSVALHDTVMRDGETLFLSADAEYRSGIGLDPSRELDIHYAFTPVVVDEQGLVIAFAPGWQGRSGEKGELLAVRFTSCPGQVPLGSRAGASLDLRIAAERFGADASRALAVSQPMTFTVETEDESLEPETIEGPGSCGQIFFPDGVSESEGMIRYGLGAELMDLEVTADGRVRGFLVLRNNGELPVTGSYVLTHVLVEADDGPYNGSVLTLAEPLELTEVVSVGAGGAMRVELDLETDACAKDAVPLAPGDYAVSVQVDLATPEGDIGFASPAVEVRVD